MPKDLIGMEPSWKGEPICFNFNLEGCALAKNGEKCKRGWHVCCKQGCFKDHCQKNH